MKSEIKNFLKKYKTIRYKKGQILVRPGDNLGKIVLEKTGYARIYKVTTDGKEISWPIIRPMWTYSLISSILENENEYYAEAITNLEAWVVPMSDFINFLQAKKEIELETYKSVIIDLFKLSEKMEKLIFAEALQKMAILIDDLAQNFGEKQKNEIVINFNVPHRVLASITGLTRETVTLQILKMQKNKILYNKGRSIVVKDVKKLKLLGQM